MNQSKPVRIVDVKVIVVVIVVATTAVALVAEGIGKDVCWMSRGIKWLRNSIFVLLYLYLWSHHKNVSWSIKGRSQILKRRLRQIFRKRGYFSAEYILTLPIIITTGSWTWDTSNIIDTEQAGRETLLRKFQGSKNSFNKNHINKIGKYLTNFKIFLNWIKFISH